MSSGNCLHFVVILAATIGLSGCVSPMRPAERAGENAAFLHTAESTRAAILASLQDKCNAEPQTTLPQYIIGYGSLMQDASRMRTSPRAGPAHPVEVAGYLRDWFARSDAVALGTTFLGAVPQPQSRLNAVIYHVDLGELRATDRREASYCRRSVPHSEIKMLEQGPLDLASGQVWIYANRPDEVGLPDASFPIVQSYVDVFLSGCFEQEERFGLAGFSRQCVATTQEWSQHWVNDRVYPRRPFIYQPRSRQIDALLARELPALFSRIRIE